MFKKSLIISFIFVISTVVQLISQIIVTRLFGATFDLDVFLAAVALPTTIITVIYGTLNDALLPFLAEVKNKSPQQYNRTFTQTLFSMTLVTLLTSLIFFLFSSQISELLYKSRGEIFTLAVAEQMRLMSVSFPFAIISTFFGSYYYLHKNLTRFPLAQMLGSISNVGIILLLVNQLNTWSLVIAFILNIIIQLFFVLPPLSVFEFKYLNFSKNVKLKIVNLLTAWLPLLIGYFALRNDTLLVRSFGSALPEGSLVQLNLIFRIFSLATSIMTIGFQIVLLPQLIEDFNKKNYLKAFRDVRNFKLIAILISILVTLLTVIVAPVLIRLLFIGGKFTASDAVQTTSFIPFFILPAIGWGINNLFFQPLIALRKQKIIGLLNIFAFALAWLVGNYVKSIFTPEYAITSGLLTLLFTGIIGSEILWQRYKKELI